MPKWFIKIEFFGGVKTFRRRVKLTEALLFLGGFPLHEWRNIRTMSIERID